MSGSSSAGAAPPAIFTQTKRSDTQRWRSALCSLCVEVIAHSHSLCLLRLSSVLACAALCSLREAVALINQLQPKRVPLLLNRILTHLKEQTASVFNADELAQLCELFSLSPDAVHTILDALSYIYEQAAYHLLSADKLKVQLNDVLQLAEPQGAAIAFVWGEQREAYMNNLRERSFGTPQVRRRRLQTPGELPQSCILSVHSALCALRSVLLWSLLGVVR